jgi:DNA modification methylase
MTVELILGDCLEVMKKMDDKSVDMVLTDSPYGLNTKSSYSGARHKVNPWADLINSAYWYSAWMKECLRIVKDDGCMWTFLNWRSLVTFQKASFDIESPIESLLIWDKEWIGPGGSRGLRPSYEMVALFTNPEFSIEDRGIPDIRRCMWASAKPYHPAEKPVDLLAWLILISTKEGDIVLDPFMGSGSSGVAAVKNERRFKGIETNPDYFAIAERRIKEAQMQPRLL